MPSIKEGEQKFFVGENEQNPVAEITFKLLEDDKIDVNRTFVSGEYAAHGIAEKLFERVVEYARAEGKKIVPTSMSMYARRTIKNTPSYRDVLAK